MGSIFHPTQKVIQVVPMETTLKQEIHLLDFKGNETF